KQFQKGLPFYWRGCQLDWQFCFQLLPRLERGGANREEKRLREYLCTHFPTNPSCQKKGGTSKKEGISHSPPF
ncbi:MAG: hypothetical protein ABGW77_04795, partial [Campylobacterales bacterium]